MTKYKCNYCECEKDIAKLSLEVVDDKVICPETLCKCGKTMESTEEDNGMPNIIRNEGSVGKSMVKRFKGKL